MKRLFLAALVAVAPVSSFAVDYVFESYNNSGLDSLPHGRAYTWGLSGSSYTNLLSNLTQENRTITSASLTLYDPRDWRDEPADVLYVNILTGIQSGTNSRTYNSNPSNYDSVYGLNAFDDSSGWRNNNLHNAGLMFQDAEAGSLLRAPDMPGSMPGTWTDLAGPYGYYADLSSVSNVTITFTEANLNLLEQYFRADSTANDGSTPTVGLGFAAECHYYLSKVKLEVTVGDAPTPPPPPQGVPDTGSTLALTALALAGLAGVARRKK